MNHLGVTGHQSIPEAIRDFVTEALEEEIERASVLGRLCGVTNLAIGADQMFAEAVLRAEGQLHVIIPSDRYETTFEGQGLGRYEALLAAASEVERLAFSDPTEEAFFAAGRRVVDLCDALLAVWDGKSSRGLGGTADVVGYAESLGKPVTILWPRRVDR